MIIIAIIQYPAYGLIIQYAKSKKYQKLRLVVITGIHIISVLIAFTIHNESFN